MDSLVHNWQEKTANTVRHDVQHLKVPAWNSKDVRHGAVELRIHRHSGAQLCTSSSSHFQSTGFSNMHSRTHVRTVASQCKLCNLSSVKTRDCAEWQPDTPCGPCRHQPILGPLKLWLTAVDVCIFVHHRSLEKAIPPSPKVGVPVHHCIGLLTA